MHFEDSLWFNWGGSIIQGNDQQYYLIIDLSLCVIAQFP